MAMAKSYVAPSLIGSKPPPPSTVGVVGWARRNLFASVTDSIFTVISLFIIIYGGYSVITWAFVNSVWEADSLKNCREIAHDGGYELGACWAIIRERGHQYMFGFYPQDLYYRPILAFCLMLVALVPVLFEIPKRGYGLIYTAIFPLIAYWLIWGGWGLQEVESEKMGGFLLTCIIGVTGIAFSLPIGILLALGRVSNAPAVKTLCVGFIEFMRGVPLITLLFIASTLLNYFLPPGTSFDLILRVLIMVTLFASAYMAEVVRAGLAAIPQGQYEAASALGLGYWQSTGMIILPQALKVAIPAIVNTFIGLFKDTTLVSIIGLLDPIGISKPVLATAEWNGIVSEPYLFIAFIFFICCFGMSRYSMFLERKLSAGERR